MLALGTMECVLTVEHYLHLVLASKGKDVVYAPEDRFIVLPCEDTKAMSALK